MLLFLQFLIFILIFVFSYFLLSRWSDKNSSRDRRHPPSFPCLPLVGSLPFLRKLNDISHFFLEKSHQLGYLFTYRAGNKLALVLNSKEVIEEALVKNARHFSSRPKVHIERVANPNIKGIALADTSPEWKQSHQTVLSILKEFGFGAKNLMEERILKEVETTIEYIKKKEGKSFDPKELSMMTISNVMTNILFGCRRDYEPGTTVLVTEVERYSHLADMIYDIAPFVKLLPTYRKKIFEMEDCGKKIFQCIEMEIAKSLQDQEKDCFVLRYLEKEGPNCDREQLNYVIRDLVIAGTDTTSITFRWMLVALANHPEVQKKLQQEIDSMIFGDRFPTLEDQTNLPYVEATILELYRWRTLLPLSLPRMTSSDCTIDGYFIPSGVWVMVNLHAAHHDPAAWGDPEVFRPERFLDKDGNVIGKNRVITFSIGRRSCLGETLARAEIFLLLTSITQRFDVLPPEGQEKVDDRCEQPVAVARNPNPFAVRLINRR